MAIFNMVGGSGGGSEPVVYKGEYIEFKADADSSGYLWIPVGGYSTTGTRDCPYSWKISVDGGAETTYTGTGSNGGSITIGGYTANSNHTIKIVPTTESYGWARAYGWDNTGGRARITEIIYESSYMGYAVSATNTGDYFRYSQYNGCTNLIGAPDEYLPNGVTTIGNYFRCNQLISSGIIKAPEENIPETVTSIGNYFRQFEFGGCINLFEPSDEKLPENLLSIGDSFRGLQYFNCTKLIYSAKEALPDSVTSIGTNFRDRQYQYCSSLVYIKGWKDLSIGNATNYRRMQYDSCNANKNIVVLSGVGYTSESSALNNSYVTQVFVPSAYLTTFKNTNNYPRAGITDSKFVGY